MRRFLAIVVWIRLAAQAPALDGHYWTLTIEAWASHQAASGRTPTANQLRHLPWREADAHYKAEPESRLDQKLGRHGHLGQMLVEISTV